MKLKGVALISFFGLALLLALSAQEPGWAIGWYNGDWQSGIPSAPNWLLAPIISPAFTISSRSRRWVDRRFRIQQ